MDFEETPRSKNTPEREEGSAPRGPLGPSRERGAKPSGAKDKFPSPRKALLWVECYVCHKKVPLCRIKAHHRLTHPTPENASSKIEEKVSTIKPSKGQLNILDLQKKV